MTPLPDHQRTPERETSLPAEDHPSTSTTKITEPITPRHRDPLVIVPGTAGPVRPTLPKIVMYVVVGRPC